MPGNDRGYQRDYMAGYRAAGRDKTRLKGRQMTRQFVGCDGEGVTLPNGYHAYNMLRIGDQCIEPRNGNVRLTTHECLSFITSQPSDRLYVGYFFDYDVTKILEDVSFDKLYRLMDREVRKYNNVLYPVDWQGFQIEYLPRKEFKVRRLLRIEDEAHIYGPWIVINDVGTFFQTPFLSSIEKWKIGTPEQWEQIASGKIDRANFIDVPRDVIYEYNWLECDLLAELMDRFRLACIDAGYVPRAWQGPGVLAEAMLKAHGVPRTKEVAVLNVNTDLVAFARSAFYGGRFEVSAVGPVNVPVWQYDINSAYPYAMRVVPCLLHGEWEHVYGSPPASSFDKPTGKMDETFALMYGSFTQSSDPTPSFYGLPMRSASGTITFPQNGTGWYWSFEVASSAHQRFVSEDVWIYKRRCACRPLAFVETVYATRQRIGKDGPGVILKLGMNSLYGKTVQSIGTPQYANPIWGSFITAYPRTMIQEFMHSSPSCKDGHCGQDIIMIATDSVASLKEREEYGDSNALGGWSKESHPNGMFIVQPGVYFGTSGKASKTRGVPRTLVDAHESAFRNAFERLVETQDLSESEVRIPQTLFCGIRYALHRRNTSLMGQWVEFGEEGDKGKVVSFDWSTKRAPAPALAPTLDRSYIMTFPYTGDVNVATVPYSKDIGGLVERELYRLAFDDQPDWVGVSDDIAL